MTRRWYAIQTADGGAYEYAIALASYTVARMIVHDEAFYQAWWLEAPKKPDFAEAMPQPLGLFTTISEAKAACEKHAKRGNDHESSDNAGKAA